MINLGIFVDKNSLEYKIGFIRQVINRNREMLNTIVHKYTEFSDQTSGSKALDVLKLKAGKEIPRIISQLDNTLAEISSKLIDINQRYLDLCGSCSLDELDLEENINNVDRQIHNMECLKRTVVNVGLFSVSDIDYQIDRLQTFRTHYERKLEGLREFNYSIKNIFSGENDSLYNVATSLRLIAEGLGINVDTNVNDSHLYATDIKEQFDQSEISYDDFYSLYEEQYGFTKKEIDILWKIKIQIDSLFETQEEADFFFNYLIGIMYYNPSGQEETLGWGFNIILQGPSFELKSEKDIKEFLINNLKLSEEEADWIYYVTRIQHSFCEQIEIPSLTYEELSNKESTSYNWLKNYLIGKGIANTKDEVKVIINSIIENGENSEFHYVLNEAKEFWSEYSTNMQGKLDFTHYSITTATILHQSETASWTTVEKVGEGFDDEAGWYGDVFGLRYYVYGGGVSINNTDYMSDLDAENIVSYMKNNNLPNIDVARKIYYNDLDSGKINRASYFLENNPTAQEELSNVAFKGYVKKNLVITSYQDYERYYQEYQLMLKKEFDNLPFEEQIEYIEDPNVYNFAYSLVAGSNNYEVIKK